MTSFLTYVEIDVPAFVIGSPPQDQTFRFGMDTLYSPSSSIDAIPSLLEVQIDPAIISLGENLGTRATVTCTFRDHRHIMDAEPFAQGTFWGKFRARYGLKLGGLPLRVIIGEPGQALELMETRHFLIDSTDGPSKDGKFKIIAKDVLKLADGDKAQAPVLSNGFLLADITNTATSATLSPSGVGNDEYLASGLVAIGGNEICSYTRSGDTLTLSRGIENTQAVAHKAQDRVQQVLTYDSADPASIIADLLTSYAGVDNSWIDLGAWQAEIATFLNTVYTSRICEPTSVATLVSELIEQVGLALWWDDINQQVRLRVIRPVPTTADVFNADNILADSTEIVEQPDKRLSRVYTYFNRINPLVALDQLDNFRSTSFSWDFDAEQAYGGVPAIKNIYSRWIGTGGRSIADTLGNVLLARFHDAPRRVAFSLLRGSLTMPVLGSGYQIGSYQLQDTDGNEVLLPAQITRLNPRADILEIEAEEMSPDFPAGGGGGSSPGEHVIIIDASDYNIDLRTIHDNLYGVPVSGNVILITIAAGVVIGSTSTSDIAVDVGTWPAGVSIRLTNNGRIQGKGGDGGRGGMGTPPSVGSAGSTGGTALYTRQAITYVGAAGEVWSGGGGGGGSGTSGNVGGTALIGGSGGGGGAGTNAGNGAPAGTGINAGNPGNSGSSSAGGSGGAPGAGGSGGGTGGGTGGGPGLAGGTGGTPTSGVHTVGGAGGVAGRAIDGVSFVTFSGGSGDIRGSQVN